MNAFTDSDTENDPYYPSPLRLDPVAIAEQQKNRQSIIDDLDKFSHTKAAREAHELKEKYCEELVKTMDGWMKYIAISVFGRWDNTFQLGASEDFPKGPDVRVMFSCSVPWNKSTTQSQEPLNGKTLYDALVRAAAQTRRLGERPVEISPEPSYDDPDDYPPQFYLKANRIEDIVAVFNTAIMENEQLNKACNGYLKQHLIEYDQVKAFVDTKLAEIFNRQSPDQNSMIKTITNAPKRGYVHPPAGSKAEQVDAQRAEASRKPMVGV